MLLNKLQRGDGVADNNQISVSADFSLHPVQVLLLKDAASELDASSLDQLAKLSWPDAVCVTVNFHRSVVGSHNCSSEHARRPAFLLMHPDGSILLLSEREAQYVLCARHTRLCHGASLELEQQVTTVVHLAYARFALPARPGCLSFALAAGRDVNVCAADALTAMAANVVGVQLFAGDTVFLSPGDEAAETYETRHCLLHKLLLGTARGAAYAGAAQMDACKSAVKRLLALRLRSKHWHGSDVHELYRAAEQTVLAQGLVR